MAGKIKHAIQTTIISTRIRLARNFAAYPFPRKMNETQAKEIVYLVETGLKSVGNFAKYEIKNMEENQLELMQEEYLISPALSNSVGGAVFVSGDDQVSIMVNEEDHLRQQYISKDFHLKKAYERIYEIDKTLSMHYDFAFDTKLGYLTACPSNLGTGMRASVMMFLPAIVWSGDFKKILPELRAGGMTVRGAFGEGTGATGYVYQISNERTLGQSEKEIIEEVEEVALYLCELEARARDLMLSTAEMETRDRCLRAYGLLTNCVLLSAEEYIEKIADIKLGWILGFLQLRSENEFNEFLDDMRPAIFKLNNELKKEDERLCDAVRAEVVSRMLKELVWVEQDQ